MHSTLYRGVQRSVTFYIFQIAYIGITSIYRARIYCNCMLVWILNFVLVSYRLNNNLIWNVYLVYTMIYIFEHAV